MADLVFLLVTIGFFAVMVLLVRACDHVIGPDPIESGRPDVDDARPAHTTEVPA
jgi:hypothetical protein